MSSLPIRYRFGQKGQALLLILLIMSVVLTVTLSVVARSVTDITISKSEDNSIRAFNAAEAGVEKAIVGSVTSGNTYSLGSGATYIPIISELGGGSNSFIYPSELQAGESATFWFVSHDSDGNITCPTCNKPSSHVTICWGEENTSPSSNTTPAILMEFFYDPSDPLSWNTNPKNFSAILVLRVASDPNTRTPTNNFSGLSKGSCSIGSKNFAFQKKVFFKGGGSADDKDFDITNWSDLKDGALIMVRAHIFYNSDKAQPVGIITQGNLPPQGKLIQSTGVSGDSQRKLSIFQGYPEPPFAFNSAIFSGSSIEQ